MKRERWEELFHDMTAYLSKNQHRMPVEVYWVLKDMAYLLKNLPDDILQNRGNDK